MLSPVRTPLYPCRKVGGWSFKVSPFPPMRHKGYKDLPYLPPASSQQHEAQLVTPQPPDYLMDALGTHGRTSKAGVMRAEQDLFGGLGRKRFPYCMRACSRTWGPSEHYSRSLPPPCLVAAATQEGSHHS